MPDEYYDLADLIRVAEQKVKEKGCFTRADLRPIHFETSPNVWVQKQRFENVKHGGFRLTDTFYDHFQKDYPVGLLRQDQRTFIPKEGLTRAQWEPAMREILDRKARVQNLLIEEMQFIKKPSMNHAFEYNIKFYPARYQMLNEGQHQLLFDYMTDASAEHHIRQARVSEGKGNWLEGLYRRQLLTQPVHKPYAAVMAHVFQGLEKRYGFVLKQIDVLSETHHLITPPHISERFSHLDRGIYIDLNTKERLYASNFVNHQLKEFQDISESYSKQFLAYLKQSGRGFSSLVFRSMPALSLALAAQDVLGAENKIDTATRIATGMSGGLTASGVCALVASSTGPLGMFSSALACGMGGSVSSEMLYERWTRWIKRESKSDTPFINLGRFHYPSSIEMPEDEALLSSSDDNTVDDLITLVNPDLSEDNVDAFLQTIINSYEKTRPTNTPEQNERVHSIISGVQSYLERIKTPQKSFDQLKREQAIERVERLEHSAQALSVAANLAFQTGHAQVGRILGGASGLASVSSAIYSAMTLGVSLSSGTALLSGISTLFSVLSNRKDRSTEVILQAIYQVRQDIYELRSYLVQVHYEMFQFWIKEFDKQYRISTVILHTLERFEQRTDYQMIQMRSAIDLLHDYHLKGILINAHRYGRAIDFSDLTEQQCHTMMSQLYQVTQESFASYLNGLTTYAAERATSTSTARDDLMTLIQDGKILGYVASLFNEYGFGDDQRSHMMNVPIWYNATERFLRLSVEEPCLNYDNTLESSKGADHRTLILQAKNFLQALNVLQNHTSHLLLERFFNYALGNATQILSLDHSDHLRFMSTIYAKNITWPQNATTVKDEKSLTKVVSKDCLPTSWNEAYVLERMGMISFNLNWTWSENFDTSLHHVDDGSTSWYLRKYQGFCPQMSFTNTSSQQTYLLISTSMYRHKFYIPDSRGHYTEGKAEGRSTLLLNSVLEKHNSTFNKILLDYRHQELMQNYNITQTFASQWRRSLVDDLLKARDVCWAVGIDPVLCQGIPVANYDEKSWITAYETELTRPKAQVRFHDTLPVIDLTSVAEFKHNLQTIYQKITAYLNANTLFDNPFIGAVEYTLDKLEKQYQALLVRPKTSVPTLKSLTKQVDDLSQDLHHALTQNDVLIDQNQKLINLLTQHFSSEKSTSGSSLFVNAAPLFLEHVFMNWKPSMHAMKLSDERVYVNPKNSQHTLFVRKLGLNSWDNLNPRVNHCPTQTSLINHCEGDEFEYIEYLPSRTVRDAIQSAFIEGAVSTILLEAIGDILVTQRFINTQQAQRLKFAMNLAMIAYFVDSLTEAGSCIMMIGLAHASYTLLRFIGISSPTARITTTTLSCLASHGRSVSSVDIVSGIARQLGGHFGLWAEKKVLQPVLDCAENLTPK